MPRYKALFNTTWLLSICHMDHMWGNDGTVENLAKLNMYLDNADLTRCHQVRQLLLRVQNRNQQPRPQELGGIQVRTWVGPLMPSTEFALRDTLDRATKLGAQYREEGQKLKYQTDQGYWQAWVKIPHPGRSMINNWDYTMMWNGWWKEDPKEAEAHSWWLWIVSGTMRGLFKEKA